MTILVTGGSGFIGTNFCKFLLKKNLKVINIDCFTYAANKSETIRLNQNKNYKIFKVNIGDSKKINQILKKYQPRYIVNFAAESHVDNSIVGPAKFVKYNTYYFSNFLNSCYNYFVHDLFFKKKFRFIHISTDEVYGSLKNGEKKFSEKNKFFPNSPYAASKASSDLLARSWFKTYNFPIITTNCSNNYGAFQHSEKLIPKVIQNCLSKKTIPIYGTGKNIRDWIYVEDHCEAIFHIMKKGKIGESYNIGSNNEIDNITLVKTICKLLNKKLKNKTNYQKLIEYVTDRKGHDFRYAINSSKIKKLGWRPNTNFKNGLKKTIDFYIKNYEN